jgi:subtilisin-like proprotein convertase family protein
MEHVAAITRTRSWLFSAGLFLLAACSSDTTASSAGETGGSDSSVTDTAVDSGADGSATDSGASDSGDDSADSGATDTGGTDTNQPDAGTVENGQPCTADQDCVAGLCVGVPGVAGQSVCSVICRTDADCAEGLDCVPVTVGSDGISACLPVDTCLDGDGDGFGLGAACLGTDCDDTAATINSRGEELCDGVDNDCDGLVDDSPIDAGRACETGFAGGCAQGLTVCEANAIFCQPSVAPSAEVCDGIDNDCDGAADEEESGEPLSRRCYDGPAATDGVGLCGSGRQSCSAGDFGGCLGQVLPSAEICDDLDNDCDGVPDDETTEVNWYVDADRDGYGSATAPPVFSCVRPEGYVLNADDCDDSRASVSPLGVEVAGDGIDQDCDGTEDCFVDMDSDGFASTSVVRSADTDCSDPGEVDGSMPGGDCDDADGQTYPGAFEIVGNEADNDCNGAEICFADRDGDGVRTTEEVLSDNVVCTDAGEGRLAGPAGDCDDRDPAIRPGQSEICNGVDDDCNNEIDDRIAFRRYFLDRDGDGYGATGSEPTSSCAVLDGYVENDQDCRDEDASVRPGAEELTGDGLDQNCDGRELCFVDGDNDGFRTVFSVASIDTDCDDDGEALAAAPATDCNDANRLIRPGATELPGDGVDQNCDGGEICFVDADADGYRLETTVVSADAACDAPGEARSTAPTGDCDDTNLSVRPGAAELCNGEDDDCDGTPDDGLSTVDYYADADGDGFGDAGATAVASCSSVAGSVANNRDCDDGSSAISPSATELAGDGVDQNCDGQELCYVDADNDAFRGGDSVTLSDDADCSDDGEATAGDPLGDCNDSVAEISPLATELPSDGVDQNCDGIETCFADADGDGYRPDAEAVVASDNLGCADAGEATAAAPVGDCDDADAFKNPGQAERCDGIDNNCIGSADEDVVTQSYYADADGDGAGDALGTPVVSCSAQPGRVANSLDCNDRDDSVFGGATEVAGNGVDNDCDGEELCFADEDLDGFASSATLPSSDVTCTLPGLASDAVPSGDCNDSSEDVNPGAAEAAGDGVDQDCNGVELCFADGDRDGYRTELTLASPRLDCSGLGEALATAPSVDCDDASAQRYPGAVETCNLLDDDCDGTVDDGVGTLTYYPDLDRDGFGDASSLGVASCLPVATYVLNAADCDDTTSAVRPGVSEVSGDGVDQNCDGLEFCFADADNDGYRPNSSSVVISANASCGDSGEATAGDPVGDCNDLVAAIFPTATELVADGVDQNCDGSELCYADADNDGYRPNATATVVSANLVCTDAGELGASAPTTDCNDLQAAIYPGATEVISDGIDQDCNGGELCYLDNDSDGYRPNATATLASADLDCLDAREARGAAPTTDCNDNNAAVNPGVDADSDGLNACLDCVDSDNRIPGGTITVAGNVASVEAGTNALPDNQTRNFRANINLGATVSDMNVRINLTHTYDGDLAISLLSPAGTQVSLSNRLGGSGQNFTNTVFDDEASTAISAGSAPFTGSFRPSSTLNAVDGQGLSGNWRLRVEDLANIDSGSLISWSVEFVTACP